MKDDNPYQSPDTVTETITEESSPETSLSWRTCFGIASVCSTSLPFVLGEIIGHFYGLMNGEKHLELLGGGFLFTITLGFFAHKSDYAKTVWFFFLCFLYLCWFILLFTLGVMLRDFGK